MKWEGTCTKRRRSRSRSRWPLWLAFSLALFSLALPPGGAQETPSPSLSESWDEFETSLLLGKRLSMTLEAQLSDLRADNERLQTLWDEQAVDLRTLSGALDQSATSLTRALSSLERSNELTASLRVEMSRLRLAVYIGIPIAAVSGLILGSVMMP